jgi:DNA repair exonuclease SbcCD nuclease subunit
MKVILLSDVHVVYSNPKSRLDDVTATQFKKLDFVFETARKYGAPIIHAGDFCDSPRSWYLAPVLIQFFRRRHDVRFYTVYGQHDLYMRANKAKDATILGVLQKAGLIKILDERPTVCGPDVVLYGLSYGEKAPGSFFDVDKSGAISILAVHDTIGHKPSMHVGPYKRAKEYLSTLAKFRVIIAGDIHQRFEVKVEGGKDRYIVNCGPMLRLEANQYNMSHNPGFYMYDTKTGWMKWISIPSELSPKVLSREHLERHEEVHGKMEKFIERLKAKDLVAGTSFEENLEGFLKDSDVEEEALLLLWEIIGGK